MSKAVEMLSEAMYEVVAEIEQEKEVARKEPTHAMYEDIIEKVKEALNTLYTRKKIKVGHTLNSRFVTTKTGRRNVKEGEQIRPKT